MDEGNGNGWSLAMKLEFWEWDVKTLQHERTGQVCELDQNFAASNISGNKWIHHWLGLRYFL